MKYKKSHRGFVFKVNRYGECIIIYYVYIRSYGIRDSIGCVLNMFYVHVNT